MFNDINSLDDQRRFIRWLKTGKQSNSIKGGVGVHANCEEKKVTSPLPSKFAAAARHPDALTLSNALAIKTLPSASSLPLSLNHEPLNDNYARLANLWTQWQSNAHAICNSVYIRGSNIMFFAKLQHDLTEQIKAHFTDYDDAHC